MKLPRLIITAPGSGTGKTMITCGILQALKKRGLNVSSFKCGPDYIDPMFHREAIGVNSYNLDSFLCGRNGVRELLLKNGKEADIAIIEGVMGYYDGLAGVSVQASAYDIADLTDTPSVLVMDCRGVSVSIVPYIQGFLNYRKNSHIHGVILNRLSPAMYGRMKQMIETQTGITVYGYVPVIKEGTLDSRYLGLKLPHEVEGLRQRLEHLAETMEETLDLDGLIELAVQASPEKLDSQTEERTIEKQRTDPAGQDYRELRIGLAKDEAFCFVYQDNLDLIKSWNVTLVPFSPIHDQMLPDDLDGLLLYGGYPELYAKELSENAGMRMQIKDMLECGMPCMAECGGFMYLQQEIQNEEGECFAMAGVLPGKSYHTSSLKRFGYITLKEGTVFGQEVGEIPAHEFHYYDSEMCGEAFRADKPLSVRSWRCMMSTDTLLAGYPHIHYYGNPRILQAYLDACRKWKKKEERRDKNEARRKEPERIDRSNKAN